MTNELKNKLQSQYDEMYKIDWSEIIWSTIAGVGLGVLAIAYFVLAV
jgi:hypothetical protein